MTYQPQQPYQPPVMPGRVPMTFDPHPTPERPAKSRAVPVLIAALSIAVIVAAGLAAMLLTGVKVPGAGPAGLRAVDTGSTFTQVRDSCGVVAGYEIGDAGKTVIMSVGGQFMNSDTMGCVFDQLSVPAAVREHVATTRALDGQQTDSWSGYTARWTYHPDAGLQMTIRAA